VKGRLMLAEKVQQKGPAHPPPPSATAHKLA
jgi:hypothetical protein